MLISQSESKYWDWTTRLKYCLKSNTKKEKQNRRPTLIWRRPDSSHDHGLDGDQLDPRQQPGRSLGRKSRRRRRRTPSWCRPQAKPQDDQLLHRGHHEQQQQREAAATPAECAEPTREAYPVQDWSILTIRYVPWNIYFTTSRILAEKIISNNNETKKGLRI